MTKFLPLQVNYQHLPSEIARVFASVNSHKVSIWLLSELAVVVLSWYPFRHPQRHTKLHMVSAGSCRDILNVVLWDRYGLFFCELFMIFSFCCLQVVREGDFNSTLSFSGRGWERDACQSFCNLHGFCARSVGYQISCWKSQWVPISLRPLGIICEICQCSSLLFERVYISSPSIYCRVFCYIRSLFSPCRLGIIQVV